MRIALVPGLALVLVAAAHGQDPGPAPPPVPVPPAAPVAADRPVDPRALDQAVDRGAKWLLENLDLDPKHDVYRSDEILLYALLHCGRRKDARVGKLLDRMLAARRDAGPFPVYNVSLRAMALAEHDKEKHQLEVARCAWWLVNAQTDNGQWDYQGPQGPPPDAFEKRASPLHARLRGSGTRAIPTAMVIKRDQPARPASPRAGFGRPYRNTSTAQYAVLGLYAAHRSHVLVPQETWTATRDILLKMQFPDGLWGYIDAEDTENGFQPDTQATPCMTASNLSVLAILDEVLDPKDPKVPESAKRGFDSLARGLETLIRKPPNPPGPNQPGLPPLGTLYHYYWMFTVERAAILWGRERIGTVRWFDVGASDLIQNQAADGSWGEDHDDMTDRLISTSFALLFLRRAVPPRASITGGGH